MTEVFILKFNGATKLAYCFSREELKLYKVRINKHDSRVKPPMKFKLKVVSTDESDVVSPDNDLLGQTLNITERGDGVSMARNEIRLKAYIMFSEDPNHHTYNKEIAFSDWYGYINCVALENRNSLERGKVYKAEVFINDLSNENRLFAIRNRPLPTVNPEEIPQVLAKLNTYENRHRHVNLDEQAKKRAQRRVEFASENECFWVGDVVQNSEPNLEKRDEQVLETVQVSFNETLSLADQIQHNTERRDDILKRICETLDVLGPKDQLTFQLEVLKCFEEALNLNCERNQ